MSDPADQNDPSARLKALDDRIKAAKGEGKKSKPDDHHSQAQMAWRMVIELVAGLGIGFGIGYGLDVLFDTTPIFMVLFIFFGLAAGVKTMMRSAAEMQNEALAKTAAQGTAKQADKQEED